MNHFIHFTDTVSLCDIINTSMDTTLLITIFVLISLDTTSCQGKVS